MYNHEKYTVQFACISRDRNDSSDPIDTKLSLNYMYVMHERFMDSSPKKIQWVYM